MAVSGLEARLLLAIAQGWRKDAEVGEANLRVSYFELFDEPKAVALRLYTC